MWQSVFLILPLILTTSAIKVSVDNVQENATQVVEVSQNQNQSIPIYYELDNVDSYLLPPNQNNPEETLTDSAPPTYLVPPSPEKQSDFFYPPSAIGEQSDWYPISQTIAQNNPQLSPQQELPAPGAIPIFLDNVNQSESLAIIRKLRGGTVFVGEERNVPYPSRELVPPSEHATNDFLLPPPSAELELPSADIKQQFNIPSIDYNPIVVQENQRFNPSLTGQVFVNAHLKAPEPTLALHLTPPKLQFLKYKNPTKLYPKKFAGGFKPIPIPIGQFADQSYDDLPKAKPVKPFKPVSSVESEYLTPSDEKNVYLFEQAEQKRKLKGSSDSAEEQLDSAVEETYGEPASTEQEALESSYSHPGRNAYPAPLRQAPPAVPQAQSSVPPAGDRTEFRMHGMKGPHSYQFGYDTGKGKNRQFRYEERDNDGHVRGHYGYVDRSGKLRVVNYDAHPEHGFHADPAVEKE